MSTPIPTRIEREAGLQAKRMWGDPLNPQAIRQREYFVSAYLKAATSEINRAAPVVKALERVKNYIPASDYEVLVHVEQILETYKNDNV